MGTFNKLKEWFLTNKTVEKSLNADNTVPQIYIDPLQYRIYTPENATMLLKRIQESINIANIATNPRVFFQSLYFILSQLIYLAQFEKKIKFTGEVPSTAYLRIINNLDNTVDNFIERAYNQELSYSSQITENRIRLARMIDFLSQLKYDIEYSDDFCNVSYYKGKLYTPSNIQTIHDLQKTIMDTYIREFHSLPDSKITADVKWHRDISYKPYHILSPYDLLVEKNELTYEYSGNAHVPKTDFYAISSQSLPILQNLIDKVNEAIQKEVDKKKLPSTLIFDKDHISVDTQNRYHSKLYYHPIDYHGNSNYRLYTISIRIGESNINLFFDKNNHIINGDFYHLTNMSEIRHRNSVTFSSDGYSCILGSMSSGLFVKAAYHHVGGTKTELFDYEREERDKNHLEYQKIVDLLGEKAPKSYSGYMRMKNQNTKNYQKLMEMYKNQI